MNKKLNLILGAASASMVSLASAGDGKMIMMEPPILEPAPSPGVSGTLDLSYNSHFISYGADVWGLGSDTFDDALFNPSIELAFDIGNSGVDFLLGTWWDVNDNAVSDIGRNIQEVDVWAGFAFEAGPVSVTLLYQQWYYAEDTEHIVDLILGFDAPLNPSLTIHGRPEEGASGGDTGVFFVPGIEPGVEFGIFSLAFPVNVGFATDGYHGGDGGFAYVSAGVSASVPLKSFPLGGEWALSAGATYYHTEDSVIPGNPDSDFVTLTAGISCSF
ncbi:hypothetical protein BH23VER1_BH23VER1_10500 [soil metagenome]